MSSSALPRVSAATAAAGYRTIGVLRRSYDRRTHFSAPTHGDGACRTPEPASGRAKRRSARRRQKRGRIPGTAGLYSRPQTKTRQQRGRKRDNHGDNRTNRYGTVVRGAAAVFEQQDGAATEKTRAHRQPPECHHIERDPRQRHQYKSRLQRGRDDYPEYYATPSTAQQQLPREQRQRHTCHERPSDTPERF